MYARIAITCQQILYGALGGTLGILALYSYRMGISWQPRVAAIMRGFAVILIANLAMAVLKGHTHGVTMGTADDIGEIVYLLSYLYWAWCFLEKEQPVPASAPLELVTALARELETLKSTKQVSTQV